MHIAVIPRTDEGLLRIGMICQLAFLRSVESLSVYSGMFLVSNMLYDLVEPISIFEHVEYSAMMNPI
jgi:hypothetical protein